MEPYILIVDQDKKFLETIQQEHYSRQFKIKFAETGKEAQLFISAKKETLYGIFVNPQIASPSGLSVIKSALIHRPITPIYMLMDKETKLDLSHSELKKIGVRSVLQKPIQLKDMVELLSPILIHFDSKAAIESAKNNRDQIGQEVLTSDPNFTPIRADDFLSGSKSFFDVYVRLSSGRYIKLLQAGDAFTPERLTTYLNKGITYFYIKKEIQQVYLKYCDHITTALLQRNNVSLEIKTSQTLNQGEETFKFFQNQGISEVNLQYATKFVKNVQDLTAQIGLQSEDTFQSLMNDIAAYEHAAGTSAIACLLLKELEIQMDQPVQIVGLASLLHDIGLCQLSENIRHEDENKMTKDELTQYRTHPGLGAKILSNIRGTHPTVLQAIEQHHMRINGKGFPDVKNNHKINKISEIVGISDEFQKIIQINVESESQDNLLQQLERKIFPNFSRQIVYAFRSAFFPKKTH
ncbi:MAG: HD domain-containing protein [Bdellovibrio sp.]|nr:HD domain-containing protein [Bdellovibrio sp.]